MSSTLHVSNLFLPVSLLAGLLMGSGGLVMGQLLPTVLPAYQPPAAAVFPVAPDGAGAAAVLAGRVTDERGQPFFHALVVIGRTNLGVVTDSAGRYRLPVPSAYLPRNRRVKVVVGWPGFYRQSLTLDARLTEQPVIQLVQDLRPTIN